METVAEIVGRLNCWQVNDEKIISEVLDLILEANQSDGKNQIRIAKIINLVDMGQRITRQLYYTNDQQPS